MYFSRVKLDENQRRKLSHLGAYHNWVESAFTQERSQEKDGQRKRHLWRLENIGVDTYLLIVSENRPDLKELETYGVDGSVESKNYDQFLNNLKEGEVLRFKLEANPTMRKAERDKKLGRIIPVSSENIKDWLINKGKLNGFSVEKDQVEIGKREKVLLSHNNNSRAWLSKVEYYGFLTITNLDQFKNALVNGIGREKAYGMGLLTVAPVKN